jgi:poly(3-hydroxyalkanoate) synthetase
MNKDDDISFKDLFDYSNITDFESYVSELLNKVDVKENLDNWQKFITGINLFTTSSYKRNEDLKIIWQNGSARLLAWDKVSSDKIILFIPSLINKSYILDLKKNNSLVEYLAKDFKVLVLDWQEPILTEENFTIEDYIIKRIIPAIKFIAKNYSGKITLAGYCLGGVLGVAAAICAKKYISSLILLATPWDFSHVNSLQDYSIMEKYLDNQPFVSAGLIHSMFYIQNFKRIYDKYIEFSGADQNSKKFETFIAVEKWASDGISLTKPLMKQLYNEFCQKNIAANNNWKISKSLIDPQKLDVPCLIIIPTNDNIVPPKSTDLLTKHIKNNTLIKISSGHVGMIIGSKAKKKLWLPLKKWINNII